MEIEKDNVNNGKDLFEVEETDSTLGKFKLKTIQPYESSRHLNNTLLHDPICNNSYVFTRYQRYRFWQFR